MRFLKILISGISILAILWTIVVLWSMVRPSGKGVALTPDFMAQVTKWENHPNTELRISDLNGGHMEVRQGDTLRACYSIVNLGKDSLYIHDVNPDCTCTDYVLGAMCSAPGDTLMLTLIVDTQHKYGENLIHCVLETNTEERMSLIKLRFFVKTEYADGIDSLMVRNEVNLGNMSVGHSYTYELLARNVSSTDMLLNGSTSCSCMELAPSVMTVVSHAEKSIKLVIAPVISGDYSEYAILRNVDSKSMMRIDIHGYVADD